MEIFLHSDRNHSIKQKAPVPYSDPFNYDQCGHAHMPSILGVDFNELECANLNTLNGSPNLPEVKKG